MRRIPAGRLSTYGQLARRLPFRCTPRVVGFALHALPSGNDVPWHRVINAGGRISFPPRSAAWRRQRDALSAEGVRPRRGGTYDLSALAWPARSDAPLLP